MPSSLRESVKNNINIWPRSAVGSEVKYLIWNMS